MSPPLSPPDQLWLAVLLGALPFLFLAAVALLRHSQGRDRPGSVTDAILVWAIISYLATEILSAVHSLAFVPFLLVWIAALGAVAVALWRAGADVRSFWPREHSLPRTIVVLCALVTLFIALTTVPNNWDSQAYHLPRIEHWLQNQSLTFYPSWNMRQNDFAPLAEYLLLQTRALSGLDLYYPLIQWISMVGSIAAVFRITTQLGGRRVQCWIASVFLATLPIGILESTSTQTDYLEAVFLLIFITLGLDAVETRPARLIFVLGAAVAGLMTGLTKPIGFMLGAGFAVWFAFAFSRGITPGSWLRRMVGIAILTAVIMGPFLGRLMAGRAPDSESMHFSASFGLRPTLDTMIRHGVSNIALGIPEIDKPVLAIAESATRHLGLQAWRADTSDPEYPTYTPPEGLLVLHEDLGPNPLHTILLALALAVALWRLPVRPARQSIYLLAWLGGFVIFCSLIRFSMWEVRYQLPGFAAAAPLFGLAWPPAWEATKKTTALVLALTIAALPALIFNESRTLIPLWRAQFPSLGRDRPSYLSQSRLERLFANQPQMLLPYQDAIDIVMKSSATQLGIMMDRDNFEYSIWRLLRDHRRTHPMRIEAVGIPGRDQWPLGPFAPELIFRDQAPAEPPPTLTIAGQSYRLIHRSGALIGHPSEVAIYARTPAG
ncbi:MAG: hypothetical protein JO000_03110 [Alphaproteobacteria bacterium]|nr:hypothetical protein [Alphaproteobacteria bacterium]